MTTRQAVHALLGFDPTSNRVQHAESSTPEPWRGVLRSRVVITGPDQRLVPCVFLQPASGAAPLAAVALHQHNNQFHLGKSEPAGMAGDPAMAYGLASARAGIATIIPDLLGFEQRRGPFEDGAQGERYSAWNLIARGQTLQGQHVADVWLAVDWLLGRQGAPDSCGVFGHSLGAQVGFFAMACDARIRAGVLNCGVGTVRSFEAAHVVHNPAWYPPGIVQFGDAEAVARAFEQQSVLLTSGRQDPIFPLDGVEAVIAAFEPGVAVGEIFAGTHELPPAVRERAIDWLVQELSNTPDPDGRNSAEQSMRRDAQ